MNTENKQFNPWWGAAALVDRQIEAEEKASESLLKRLRGAGVSEELLAEVAKFLPPG